MATHLASDRPFYVGGALAILVAVFVGFAPTYYLKPFFGTPALQTMLVALRRTDVHRRVGVTDAVWAALVVGVGFLAAIRLVHRTFAAGVPGALNFLIVPVTDMLIFALIAGAGVYYRHRRDVHKRLMFLATVSILSAAFARWPLGVVAAGPLGFFGAVDLFIVALIVHDLRSERRIHPATLWAGLLIVVSQPLRLALGQTAAWESVARFLIQ